MIAVQTFNIYLVIFCYICLTDVLCQYYYMVVRCGGAKKVLLWFELVHTKFCKFIFKVSKCTHNMMMYGELGRCPLSVMIKNAW